MSLKKVVFHPLERLDIIDVDALQDLAHNASQDYAGALLGSSSAVGLVNIYRTVAVDNATDLIAFEDFTFLGRRTDTDGNAKQFPAFMGKFSGASVSNGDCNFASFKSLVQSYVNANGVLPPTPLDTDFDVEVHGSFYPYIYIRPVLTETSTASRRFWSVADAAEITDTVSTRTGVYFEFTLSPILSTVVSDSEFPWTRIGGIAAWSVSDANVVSLPAAGVSPYFFTDAMIGVASSGRVAANTHGAAIRQGGLTGAIAWIMAHIDSMKAGGTDDVEAETPAVQRYELPKYSMSNLGYRLDDLTSRVDALQLVDSSTLMLQMTFNTNYPTISVSADPSNTFTITPYINYRPIRTLIERLEGVSIESFGASEWSTHISSSSIYLPILASLSLQVPEAYRNKHYMLTITPIFSDQGGDFVGTGTDVFNTTKYMEFKQGEAWHILPDTQGSAMALKKITSQIRQTKESSANVVFLGINVGQRGALNWSELDAYPMRFDLKITLAILRQ